MDERRDSPCMGDEMNKKERAMSRMLELADQAGLTASDLSSLFVAVLGGFRYGKGGVRHGKG
jgi:hypothetical protein